eukprot:scaffold149588_cov26-Tisochrysis_lutea.AAC.1
MLRLPVSICKQGCCCLAFSHQLYVRGCSWRESGEHLGMNGPRKKIIYTCTWTRSPLHTCTITFCMFLFFPPCFLQASVAGACPG